MKRRDFLAGSAAIAGSSLLGIDGLMDSLSRGTGAPSDQIRVGVIGPGSRGQYLMRLFLRLPDVKIAGVCDIYEPRFAQSREITGEDTPAFRDYRVMLDELDDLDAVIVATPLGLHAEHMVACLDRGLHVFGEKAMGHTVEDCDAILSAARRSGRLFQVGHQYRYAPWYRAAIEAVRNGEIGEVTHVYGYWHRNYNWRRPVPDPSLERLINWRLYRENSGGLLAELGSHHIDVANWIFGEIPDRAIGNGAVTFYHDGRETFDNIQAVFTYPSGGTMVFSSIIGNHKVGYQLNIYGTGGTVELTLEDGAYYYEPARANSAVPQEMIERGVHTSASLTTRGDMPYRGPGRAIEIPEGEMGNPNYLCCASFIESLRENTPPFADVRVGWASAVTVALGNEAIRGGMPVDFAGRVDPSNAPGRRGEP